MLFREPTLRFAKVMRAVDKFTLIREAGRFRESNLANLNLPTLRTSGARLANPPREPVSGANQPRESTSRAHHPGESRGWFAPKTASRTSQHREPNSRTYAQPREPTHLESARLTNLPASRTYAADLRIFSPRDPTHLANLLTSRTDKPRAATNVKPREPTNLANPLPLQALSITSHPPELTSRTRHREKKNFSHLPRAPTNRVNPANVPNSRRISLTHHPHKPTNLTNQSREATY